MLSIAQSGGWRGDLAAEIKIFTELVGNNAAAARGVCIITSQPDQEFDRWIDDLRLAIHQLSAFNPFVVVAITKGQTFSPHQFDGEFGLAQPVEIDMVQNLHSENV
jgi:hypothetical protein